MNKGFSKYQLTAFTYYDIDKGVDVVEQITVGTTKDNWSITKSKIQQKRIKNKRLQNKARNRQHRKCA